MTILLQITDSLLQNIENLLIINRQLQQEFQASMTLSSAKKSQYNRDFAEGIQYLDRLKKEIQTKRSNLS